MRSSKKLTIFITIMMGILALPGFVLAQDSPPLVYSEFELNTFHPSSTSADGISLDYGQVLDPMQLGLAALIQIDTNPLTWQRKTDGDYERSGDVVTRQIVLHMSAAMSFFKFGQLAVHLPFYMDKGLGSDESLAGLGDLKLSPKFAFRTSSDTFGIGVLVPVSLPTGDEGTFAGQGSATVEPRLATDLHLGKMRIALNVGYLVREEQNVDLVRGSELRLGMGGQYEIFDHMNTLSALLEVNLATQTADMFGRSSTPAEVLGGINYAFDNGFSLAGGMGFGVSGGVGAPTFRLIAQAGWTPQSFKREKPVTEDPETSNTYKDGDGDGLTEDDKCPDEAEDFDGFEDDDGCPDKDNDGDGLPDPKDKCPNKPENVNDLDDDDGCPDKDDDGDAIANHRDACPDEAEDIDGFEDKDGCPEDDNDLDEISDADDECPMLPESKNDYKDNDGCPDYIKVVGDEIQFKKRLRFERKSERVHEMSLPTVDELSASIIANPTWEEVEISVHTSGRGRAQAQQTLSEDRARTLMRLLVSAGVDPERIIVNGMGDREQLASPDSPEGRRQNERVEIKITRGEAQ